MTTLNIQDFGARGSGAKAEAGVNDAAFLAAFEAHRKTGGRIYVPSGTYYLGRPIQLQKTRNLVLFGDGGNAAHAGTRLVYIGDDAGCCLHLRTCVHARFEDLCLIVEDSAAKAILRIDAVEDGPEAVSSLNNIFQGCTFRAGPGAHPDLLGVSLRDAAHTEFRHCWFQGARVAARIGVPMRKPRPTISNGQCNNTAFDNCLFFGDILGERGTNVTFQNCEFATLPNGDGAKIDFGIGDHPQVNNVTIRDCFAINAQSHRGVFFTQGRGGAGLVMTNTRIRGYAVGIELDGAGAAMLAANVFEQSAPGATDVRLRCPADAVSLIANLHHKTIAAGNEPVVQVERSEN